MVFQPGFIFRPSTAAVSTLTIVATNTSMSSSITLPTGSQAGDLCILCELAVDNDAGAPMWDDLTGSGWTEVGASQDVQGAAPSGRVQGWFKVLEAADITAGSVTGLMDGNSFDRKAIASFRPDNPIVSATCVDYETQGTTGNPTTQTVTPTNAPCVLWGYRGTSGGSTTGTNGTLFDDGSDFDVDSRFACTYLIQNSSPTSKTYDTGDSGTWTMLGTWVIQVS